MKLLHQSKSGKQQQIFGTADVLCVSTENIYPNSVDLFDFVWMSLQKKPNQITVNC